MIEVASQLPQLITQGIATGAIYGLVALGLVLNYKAPEVLNFGRGDIVVLSASIALGPHRGCGPSLRLVISCACSSRATRNELTPALRLNRRVVLGQYSALYSGGTPPRLTQLQTGEYS